MQVLFMEYGIAGELSTDRCPQFIANDFEQFQKKWGASHRNSSADYPTSNDRAEIAVKTAKRIIIGNSNKDGSIDNDTVHRAPRVGVTRFFFISNSFISNSSQI